MTRYDSVVLLGQPGAGKSTLARTLEQGRPGVLHVSTGNIIREAANKNLESYAQDEQVRIQKAASTGAYIPDTLVQRMVANYVSAHATPDTLLLLDGVPRTLQQADFIEEYAPSRQVLSLQAPRNVLTDRLLARGRDGETPDIINQRLNVYEDNARLVSTMYMLRAAIQNDESFNTIHTKAPFSEVAQQAITYLRADSNLRTWF